MSELLEYFSKHCNSQGIPTISNEDWLSLIAQYDQSDIKTALARYITDNNIPFPIKEITEQDMQRNFEKFAKTSMMNLYKSAGDVFEKHDYAYPYSANPLGVIDKSHAYNKVSDYFQETNRMKCGSNQVDAPWDIWHDFDKLAKMNWHFWRTGALGKSDIGPATFRSAFRIGTYTATQFKPSVAKALYEKHNAVHVLDTSVGWGDRLAAFYATDSTRVYVGCDPNPDTFSVYKEQCLAYERMLGSSPVIVEAENYFKCTGSKQVEIWNLPSEDVDWTQYTDYFDFYFTSPPYFETEKYAQSTDKSELQSWNRYPTYDAWKNDFFFKVNRMVWETLKNDAYMMLNIIPPSSVKRTPNLCDEMVDDIKSFNDAHYLGKIGMRLQARPHSIVKASKNAVFVEPIWVFRKGNSTYPLYSNTFEQLFTIDA